LLRNGIDLYARLVTFCSESTELFIFAPYVKLDPLRRLLDVAPNCRSILVRWEPKDLLTGASDLEVYDLCRAEGIALYRNPRLHLKAFVNSYRSAIIGSANISSRALNIPESKTFNYELATLIDSLSIEDRLYFSLIINESQLITDSIYQQIKQSIEGKSIALPGSDFELAFDTLDKDFLISALPLSYDVPTFLDVCSTGIAAEEMAVNCATHDAALYKLDISKPAEALRTDLKSTFFAHPFISAFLANLEIDGFIFFGAAKDWIQKNCTNVPIPRKWEITENIQILYRWIIDLSDGKYSVDVPGTHSERLHIVR
ncbi:MAG TPA: hypothetical protein PLL77_15830, partial [Pyrinomonadaceae bacterium]|nr:hypothetical protein [Pyrinomonadaceae bacterium]